MALERKILGLLIITLLAIIFVGGMFRIQAVAKENCFSKDTDKVESMFVGEVKTVLAQYGAKNAGVTMTKTSEENRNVTYHVAVNLPKYISDSEEVSGKIKKALNDLSIEIECASTVFTFS